MPDRTHEFVNSNLEERDIGIVNDYNCRFLGGVAGNAGLFSNMQDLTKYVKMLLDFGAPLMRKEIFEAAIQNYTPDMSEGVSVDGNFLKKL